MNPDGARHVLLAFTAIIGGMALFGACLYFFSTLLPRWLSPNLPAVSKLTPRELLEWQWARARSRAGSNLVLGASGGITAIFVWILLRFW